jgi:hypothetical protein
VEHPVQGFVAPLLLAVLPSFAPPRADAARVARSSNKHAAETTRILPVWTQGTVTSAIRLQEFQAPPAGRSANPSRLMTLAPFTQNGMSVASLFSSKPMGAGERLPDNKA